MSLTKKDIQYVARLARLALSEEELERFTQQLGNILEHVSKLNTLKTDTIAPTTHVLPLKNVWREDVVVPPPGSEAILSNAPDRQGPYFRVKKVIE